MTRTSGKFQFCKQQTYTGQYSTTISLRRKHVSFTCLCSNIYKKYVKTTIRWFFSITEITCRDSLLFTTITLLTPSPHLNAGYELSKYDAATVGNHDIEAGHKVYDRLVKNMIFRFWQPTLWKLRQVIPISGLTLLSKGTT